MSQEQLLGDGQSPSCESWKCKCGRPWPCPLWGLYGHRRVRVSKRREEVSAMQNITVGRYDTDREVKGHDWAGWIEPEDRSWIMFVGEDPTQVQVYLSRDPETGAVL